VTEPVFARGDRGKGGFSDYAGQLVPRSTRVRIRLAGSDPHQEAIAALAGEGELETAFARRSREAEAADASIEVRLFAGGRVSPPVGWVPRGLESVVDEAFGRLEDAGRRPRIPARITRSGRRYRVELLIGLTRI
jgi:hypothetical protein